MVLKKYHSAFEHTFLLERILQKRPKFSKRTLKERNLASRATANPKILSQVLVSWRPRRFSTENLLSFANRFIQSSLREKGKIPKGLLSEMKAFAERNAINGEHYCKRCLKAHAVKIIKERELSKKTEKEVCQSIKAKTGHDGYYLDGDELINLND